MPLRRSPMPAGRKPLERRTPLAQVGAKRLAAAKTTGKPVKAALKTTVKPAVPKDVRADLVVRSKGWCEAQLIACLGRGTQTHHRITQKAGGRKGAAKERHNRLSNLMDLCGVCHAWVTCRPTEAGSLGLALREHQIPAREPVVYRGALKYLDDFGGVHDFEAACA